MPTGKKKLENSSCKILFFVQLVLPLLAFLSCHTKDTESKTERSFYYWKSILHLTGFEQKRLDSLQVKTIYLHFFDVDWDANSGKPVPNAKLQVGDQQLLKKYKVIPTIFITNYCIRQIDSGQVLSLSEKIAGLIKSIATLNHLDSIQEIQVDCDWTASSQNNYFLLLRSLKQICKTSLSATIRLHQIKFVAKTGVPPADKGLLMCYNMGNLKNPATKNSILETDELKKYTGNLSAYPLPLDVAFPLFDWKVLFRDGIYRGLLENIPVENFHPSFALVQHNRIEILKDTLLLGYELKKGDLLRSEESSLTEIKSAAHKIATHLKNAPQRVSLYHLDSVTLNKFTINELESIYHIFR